MAKFHLFAYNKSCWVSFKPSNNYKCCLPGLCFVSDLWSTLRACSCSKFRSFTGISKYSCSDMSLWKINAQIHNTVFLETKANLGLSDSCHQVWIKTNVPFSTIGIQWSRGISLGRCLYSVVHRIPRSQHPENSDRLNILMFASGTMLRKGGLKSSPTAALYLNNRCMLLWQGVSMGLLDFGSANILFRLNPNWKIYHDMLFSLSNAS